MHPTTRLLLATASFLAVTASQTATAAPGITLTALGSYREETTPGSGVCRKGIAQIGAYDFLSRRLFVTNAADNALDILDLNDPARPTLLKRVRVADLTGSTNFEPPGVAAAFGLVALAVEAIDPVSADGKVLLLDHAGRLLRTFDVGSGPERVAFSPNGRFIVVTVQGEKDAARAIDPKGGIAIIDLGHGIRHAEVRFADFSAFNSATLVASGVRIGSDPSDPTKLRPAVLDLEPHSLTVSADSRTAFASLQLNNALAAVDLRAAKVTAVLPFGLKNHDRPGNGLDASSDDGKIDIRRWPVWGAYLPDGIAAFNAHDRTLLVTANEGDTRDDAAEVGQIKLDRSVFPNASALQAPAALGGLEISTLPQDARPNAAGEYRRLVGFGARSIGIWTTSAQRVFDSGNRLERITAASALYPTGTSFFNTTDDANSFDKRSPRRGPQPLGVAVGKVGSRTYAFVGLQKQGGIIIADITEAQFGVPLGYVSTRDFKQDPSLGGTLDTHVEVNCALDRSLSPPDRSDLGPEGLLFIPAELSPNRRPLLAVNYDTSGSTRIFQIVPATPGDR